MLWANSSQCACKTDNDCCIRLMVIYLGMCVVLCAGLSQSPPSSQRQSSSPPHHQCLPRLPQTHQVQCPHYFPTVPALAVRGPISTYTMCANEKETVRKSLLGYFIMVPEQHLLITMKDCCRLLMWHFDAAHAKKGFSTCCRYIIVYSIVGCHVELQHKHVFKFGTVNC